MSTLSPPTAAADFQGMIGRSEAMRAVHQRIAQFARLRIPVLIEGETGVGKELVVQALRRAAGSRGRYVALNCAAIPRDLLESELFGHERGAFTGALRRHAGILAQANGGTLFLDEISELTAHAQAKLLRAIECGEFRPVGAERTERSDFRLIAASNESLAGAVEHGRFRLDLLHRLGAARICVPPLRDRREDIPELVDDFLRNFRVHHGAGPLRVAPSALHLLCLAAWPGNVRELRNVVEAAAAVCPGALIALEHVQEVMPGAGANGHARAAARPLTLAEAVQAAERDAIQDALERAAGNRDRAAELLGVSVATLYRRLAAGGEGAA